jgi:transposase
MNVMHGRCAGLDVHKESISACVLIASKGKKESVQVERQTFGTLTGDLQELKQWLQQWRVTHVALESTGVYWRPVWNILEDGAYEMILVNPQHFRSVPGRKTDQKDCEWLAQLLQHGLVRSSFVPAQETRELRDLTRYRVKLMQERNRVHNRIEKVLQDANLKLSSVVSDIWGVTGRAILTAILQGEEDPERLAEYAKGRLRQKKAQLRMALCGRLTAHHKFLLRELTDDLTYLEVKIARLEQVIEAQLWPHMEVVYRLCTIPGVYRKTASTLIAELGVDMAQFPDADHLASWAGLCPGACQSAGKRKSARTRNGNPHVRRALCEAAWAATRSKRSYLSALFHRVTARAGRKKALIAVARRLIIIAYHLIRGTHGYRELGPNYFDTLRPQRAAHRLLQRLKDLGHEVILCPKPELQ